MPDTMSPCRSEKHVFEDVSSNPDGFSLELFSLFSLLAFVEVLLCSFVFFGSLIGTHL